MLIELGAQTLDATDRCHVMGILNVATDSPVADSIVAVGDAPRRAAELRDAGASIIDVGAQSTRTGAAEISPDEKSRVSLRSLSLWSPKGTSSRSTPGPLPSHGRRSRPART